MFMTIVLCPNRIKRKIINTENNMPYSIRNLRERMMKKKKNNCRKSSNTDFICMKNVIFSEIVLILLEKSSHKNRIICKNSEKIFSYVHRIQWNHKFCSKANISIIIYYRQQNINTNYSVSLKQWLYLLLHHGCNCISFFYNATHVFIYFWEYPLYRRSISHSPHRVNWPRTRGTRFTPSPLSCIMRINYPDLDSSSQNRHEWSTLRLCGSWWTVSLSRAPEGQWSLMKNSTLTSLTLKRYPCTSHTTRRR